MQTKKIFKKIFFALITVFIAYATYLTVAKFTTKPENTISSKKITAEELFESKKLGIIPEQIKGNIITLKRLDLKYLDDFHKMFSDTVRKNIEYPKDITIEFSKTVLLYDMKKERDGTIVVYFIFDNKDNKLIGLIEIKDKNKEDPGQFSIWINENYWGKGRAQEATKIISDIYFKYKDENEFIANVRLWNKRSYKALLKAGFKETGKYYEDGQPTRYILKMYRNGKTNCKNKKQGVKNMSKHKKILFILMPKFRDEEFTIPFQMLYEDGHALDVAGLQEGEIIGSNGYNQKPDMQLNDLKLEDMEKYDALIIPGGPGSTTYLWNNKKIQEIIEFFNSKDKIVATICYASVAPAQAGILKGKKATVYPTDESKKIFKEQEVVFDDAGVVVLENEKIITAQSPKFAKEFGQAIINLLESE